MAVKTEKKEELSQLVDANICNDVVTDKQLISLDRDFVLAWKSDLGDQLTESEKRVCAGLFFGLSAKKLVN